MAHASKTFAAFRSIASEVIPGSLWVMTDGTIHSVVGFNYLKVSGEEATVELNLEAEAGSLVQRSYRRRSSMNAEQFRDLAVRGEILLLDTDTSTRPSWLCYEGWLGDREKTAERLAEAREIMGIPTAAVSQAAA